MSRVGKIFCTKYMTIIKVLVALLLLSIPSNIMLWFWMDSYRDTANRALDTMSSVHSKYQDYQKQVNQLKSQLAEKENTIKSIVDSNKEFSVTKYPKGVAIVTAYTPHRRSTGKNPGHPLFNVTKSGFKGGGGICAADPKYWPMGSVIYVEGLGACVVLDTGGAIKGKWRFDYYIPGDEKSAEAAAFKWGKRKAWVYVLYVPKKSITWREVSK